MYRWVSRGGTRFAIRRYVAHRGGKRRRCSPPRFGPPKRHSPATRTHAATEPSQRHGILLFPDGRRAAPGEVAKKNVKAAGCFRAPAARGEAVGLRPREEAPGGGGEAEARAGSLSVTDARRGAARIGPTPASACFREVSVGGCQSQGAPPSTLPSSRSTPQARLGCVCGVGCGGNEKGLRCFCRLAL